jgi:putative tryptophan/tyrosine transport system substrate-binding protein
MPASPEILGLGRLLPGSREGLSGTGRGSAGESLAPSRMRLVGVGVLLALAWLAVPLAGEAQPAARVARIGYLSLLPAEADAANREAFLQGLRALGYIEGQNAVIESRHSDGRVERLASLAEEIVGLKVDVIVAAPTPAIRAVQQATRTVPIVMAFSGDPVGDGLVSGLARPGGNTTGLSAAVVAAKRVEYLKAIVPKLSHVMVLEQPEGSRAVVTQSEAAGRILRMRVTSTAIRTPGDIEQAFLAMRSAGVGGVIVTTSLRPHFGQIVDLALKSRLPTVSGPREFAEAGGLMAYGPHYPDLFRRAATYVAKILKGAKPAELPVEQPTKFELVVNLKTAKALGLTVPPSVLTRADEVIQ